MNLARVEPIVNAVLYEGYLLYPYRPSSVKNQQRWTFGGVYPRAYSQAQGGSDPWMIQAECLLIGSQTTTAEINARFLHLLQRRPGQLARSVSDLPTNRQPDVRFVETLRIGQQRYQAWQEAVERDIGGLLFQLGELAARPARQSFAFPAQRTIAALRDSDGTIGGVMVREQQAITGELEVAAAQVGEQLWKITARVANLSSIDDATLADRDAALMRSFVSTHLILAAYGGEFISLTDPPEDARPAVAQCQNVGVWPVLVGAEGQRDLLLASPIILYDYPQIAPESPGDLFDGTEIDEILTLRILTMTEQEQQEMSAVDDRARALLERTQALARDDLMRLHGTIRSLRPSEEAL